jgi:CheY-like chemotaxis protein
VDLSEDDIKNMKINIAPGPYLSLSISDSGTGMTKRVLTQIFQPFFTTKQQGKGTGLGLSSVMSTMVNHYGAVTVDSMPGQGSTFNLLFPIGQLEGKEGKDAGDTRFLRGFGHLLIIDDEEALREIISGMLTDYGYKVSSASDGLEALEFYKKHGDTVDLVIIDMNLPRCTGDECFKELRKINPDVKAIISTGFSLTEETEKILEEGVHGFLQKPFEMKQLLKLITEVLD